MLKALSKKLNHNVPLRIRKIFLGSGVISLIKILSGLALLSLLSGSSDGTLTYYGTLQNCIMVLVAVIGMSIQNGITTHSAKIDLEIIRPDLISQLATILLLGICIGGLLLLVFSLSGYDLGDLLGFTEDKKFPLLGLVGISFLAILHRYYSSFLFGKGFILRGQSLDLLRNIIILVAALFWVYWHRSFDLIWIIVLGNVVVIPFLFKLSIEQPLKEIRIKLSLNSGTLQIIKAGLITAYSGILFALVSMTIRSHAIDIGGYKLSDAWEILIRLTLMYQLLVTAPLSQILLRSYVSSDQEKPVKFFKRALPIFIVLILLLSVIPESVMETLLALLFNQEVADLKLIVFLLLGSEVLRTLGMFFHSMLVSRAMILPQALFETISQAIVLFSVFYFTWDNFLLTYSIGLFISMVFWMAINLIYIRNFNGLREL
jgi:O-antigen/teichoic acid export membrane protein